MPIGFGSSPLRRRSNRTLGHAPGPLATASGNCDPAATSCWCVPLTASKSGWGPTARTNSHQAEKDGRKASSEIEQRRWVDPRRGEIRLDEWVNGWLDRCEATGRHGPKYAADARRLAQDHIYPSIGHVLLLTLTSAPSRCGSRSSRERSGRSSAGLDGCRRWPTTSSGPPSVTRSARGTSCHRRRSSEARASIRAPSGRCSQPEEAIAIANTIDARWTTLVLVAAFAGLRWGELAELRRRDLDIERRTIRVDRAVVELAGGEMLVKTPKTRAGHRTVAVPFELAEVLDVHLTRWVADGLEARVHDRDRAPAPTVQLRQGMAQGGRGRWGPPGARPRPSSRRRHDGGAAWGYRT